MRNLLATVCRPATWFAVAFLALACILASRATPAPRYSVTTGASRWDDPRSIRGGGTWASLVRVSDDGTEVMVATHDGDFRFFTTRFHTWDARTGGESAGGAWADPELTRLASGYLGCDTGGVVAALTHPGGRKFLADAPAWDALRRRMVTARAAALDDLRRTVRPVQDNELQHLFPDSFYLSPDGRSVAYVSRNGWPLYGVSELLGNGTAVEDARTGRQLAFLPGVTDGVAIAPGCRTAVSRHYKRPGVRPLLVLWDLTTSQQRAELLVAGDYPPYAEYSPDGRYVFARGGDLRWWEAETGRQVGRAEGVGEWALVDGGRVLAALPASARAGDGVAENCRLALWDVATGATLGERDLATLYSGGYLRRLSSGPSGDYLAATFDPRAGPLGWRPRPQAVVWDADDGREVCRLPGTSPVLSADGRWVATIDDEGVVRVWEVPPGQAWGEVAAYVIAATVGCWAGVALARGLARSRPADATPAEHLAAPDSVT